MSKYINSGCIRKNDNWQVANIKDLKYFIHHNREIDEEVEERFPLSVLEDKSGQLRVGGSKQLIDLFEDVDNTKMDIITKLEDVIYKGFTEDKEIVLGFSGEDKLQASGIYDFTFDFFEELFSMGRYEAFCSERELEGLIKTNIDVLFQKFKDEKRQFRFLNKDDEWYLRGITSAQYNNYDNNIAVYISLLLLSKLAKEKSIYFDVESAYISDSYLRVFFQETKSEHIKGLGDIYVGILVTNGEIRNNALTFEVYYKVVENEEYSFIGIPELKDSFININHRTGIDTFSTQMGKINDFKKYKDSMLKYIRSLGKVKEISDDVLYELMKEITSSRTLCKDTRDNFKKIYDDNLIDNSMTILRIFDKVNNITSDIDERIHLERIYNKIVRELVKNI